MTISLLPMNESEHAVRAHEPMRCDLCGSTVTDVAAHMDACVDHELALSASGRRAG